MTDWLATILIFLPLAGALFIWLLPLASARWPARSRSCSRSPRSGSGSTRSARSTSTAERTPQFEQQWSWFSDLGVSYHVGFYGFSLWLVGLTVVVMAAAIAYAFWVGRERPRAYFGLMLFLTSARIVGVFASQDLLLFYVFFEAMLIPLYVLIGVWGGPGRLGATVKFVIYTMAGSLLMLAAVIVFGLEQGTFDLVESGTSDSTWLFLGFAPRSPSRRRCSRSTAGCRTPTASRPPEVAAVLSGVISKAAVFGFLRIALPKFPEPVDDLRNVCSRSPRSGSSTARCSRSAPPTCAA